MNSVNATQERILDRNFGLHLPVLATLMCLLAGGCGGGGGSSGGGGGGQATYAASVTISGLTASGLSLALNGASSSIAANSSSFAFPTPLTNGSSYSITVSQQPTGEICSVTAGSGTVSSGPVSAAVSCVGASLTVGGTISGLLGAGLVLANGSDTDPISASATTFTFTVPVQSGSAYKVTAQSQPSAQSCSITNGTGTMGMASVANISVSCAVWVWAGGPNTANASGVYGSSGVTSPSNAPGARTGAVSWVDSAGIVWIFGGYGIDTFGMQGYLNDLWKFDPNTQQWTWVSGSTQVGAAGVYGTQGASAAANAPGGRNRAVSWRSASGDLWLFGGWGLDTIGTPGELNDLWKYSPSTGLWTWISGSNSHDQAGVYGTRGVAAPGNIPGSRDSAVAWVDSAGTLWLFGGEGIISPGVTGDMNDLWNYDPTSAQWTWLSGSSGGDVNGVYGTRGVASSENSPGSRSAASGWTDPLGRFWLFGGTGYDDGTSGGFSTAKLLNDVWVYDPGAGSWAWMVGSSQSQARGIYVAGGLGGGAPGARQGAVTWIDPSGVAWMYGGSGLDSTGAPGGLGDLWKLDTAGGGWVWVAGSNTITPPTSYGSLGVRDLSNLPGARYSGAAWADSRGNLWMFGGTGVTETSTGFLSDVWEFAYQ